MQLYKTVTGSVPNCYKITDQFSFLIDNQQPITYNMKFLYFSSALDFRHLVRALESLSHLPFHPLEDWQTLDYTHPYNSI